jgi:hypothetical protein
VLEMSTAVVQTLSPPSWPGLSRPSTTFRGSGALPENGNILPVWIAEMDQTHFPGAWPSLYGGFTLDSGSDIRMRFSINETVKTVTTAEERPRSGLVFGNTAMQVCCDTDIERAVGTVGHDVDPGITHTGIGPLGWLIFSLFGLGVGDVEVVDGRDKPGHDGLPGDGVSGDGLPGDRVLADAMGGV